ncbi:MAG TPA: hypothetical protein VM820_08160, partial [Vicinamibacterales bacterium]|nr:hypothetical protein [Vicinamibacterales bacterium]
SRLSSPRQQARDMVAALKKAGVKHQFVHYKYRGHMRPHRRGRQGDARVHRRHREAVMGFVRWRGE